MPVGVIAAAAAIARPRVATRTMASLGGDSTPAAAAAVISPTEWPASTADAAEDARPGPGRPNSASSGEQAGADDERLGHRRVADRVGVGVGAVGDEVDASPRRTAPRRAHAGRAARATGRGSRESGSPVRDTRCASTGPACLSRWPGWRRRNARTIRDTFGGFLQPHGTDRTPYPSRETSITSPEGDLRHVVAERLVEPRTGAPARHSTGGGSARRPRASASAAVCASRGWVRS